MKDSIIITVPHNVCVPGEEIDHNCDLIAGWVGDKIDKALGQYPHIIFYGDINRHNNDLNRPRSRDTTNFRILLRKQLKKQPLLLLDIHSFSKETEKYKGADVAIGTDRHNIEGYLKDLADYLYDQGYNSFVVSDLEADIIKEAKEYGIPAFLLEFNEEIPKKTHSKIIKLLIEYFLDEYVYDE